MLTDEMRDAVVLAGLAVLLVLVSAWVFWEDRVPAWMASGKRVKPWTLLATAALSLVLGCWGWYLKPPGSETRTAPATDARAGGTGGVELSDGPAASQGDVEARGDAKTNEVDGTGTAAMPGPVERMTDATYLASQHLLLNAPAERADGLLIRASRLMAMTTFLLIAIEAIRRLFADSFQRLSLSRSRDHVVVCGLGRTGYALVRELRDPKRDFRDVWKHRRPPRVVVIERDPANALIESARELGAVVVQGDATDERLLDRVSATRASHVFFVTGSDEANIEGATDLSAAAARRGRALFPDRLWSDGAGARDTDRRACAL